MPGRSLAIGRGAAPGRSPPSCRGGTSAWLFRSPKLRAFLAGLCLAAAGPAQASPYLPTDDAEILERLPVAGDAGLRTLRKLHDALRRDPSNLSLALMVAARDHEVGRAAADPRYDGYAEAALAPWIGLDQPPTAVLLQRATLRQSRHDFHGALDDLGRVIDATPRNAQAWLTRAVVLQVEGDYPQALASCGQLRQLAQPLVFEICDANVRVMGDHAASAYGALEAALERQPDDAALRLWALTMLGETAARLGDPAAAEAQFRQALALNIEDSYLLGAYADFLLDQGRPAEIRTLLAQKTRIDPLMLRLALADAALGSPDLAADTAVLAERFGASRQRGDRAHLREEARFTLHILHQPAAALDLALANWAVQREPWDARILLEAALAAGRPEAARPVLDWLNASHIQAVRLQALADEAQGAAR